MIIGEFGCSIVLAAIAVVGLIFAFTARPAVWLTFAAASLIFYLATQHRKCRRCGAAEFAFTMFGGLCTRCHSADLACKGEHLGNIEQLRAQLLLVTDLRARLELLQAILQEAEHLADREESGVDLGGAELVRRYASALARTEAAASADDAGSRVEDLTYASRECLESREPIAEEWCFCPIEADEKATGFIVLRDVPKTAILVDDRRVNLSGGFRGFCGVPRGEHTLVVQPYDATALPSGVRVYVHGGGCVVLRYDDDRERLVEDEAWGAVYASKAVRGIMDSYLYPWPA